VSDLAKQAIKAARGETVAAVRLLEDEIRSDPAKYHIVMDPLVVEGCRRAVSDVQHQSRTKALKSLSYVANGGDQAERVKLLARGNVTIFIMPLLHGTPLGEGTKEDVLETEQHHRKQAKNQMAQANFLANIAKKLTGNKKVKDVFTEQDLAKICPPELLSIYQRGA
jgi:hypothetical protein